MEKIIINDYIRGEPLAEENLDDVLDLVNKIRLSMPQKSIWLYTGYAWEHIFDEKWHYHPQTMEKLSINRWKRQQIVSECNVLIDGRYLDNQKDITLKWRGSNNQKVIDIQKSIQQGEIVLWCN
jgi:anaerobic ribonucleoside-triphosphate reductase activating protein